MIRLRVSRRDRRTLLGGAIAISALALIGRGGPLWWKWQAEARLSAQELATEVARAEATVALAPALRDSMAVRTRRYVELAPLLIGGASASASAGELAARTSGAAQAAEVRLSSVQVVQSRDSIAPAGFRRIAVRASGEGDIRGLTSLLLALERGPQLLRIRELAVTQTDAAGAADRPEVLRIELVVEGLALARPARGSE